LVVSNLLAQVELSKERVTGKTVKKAFNQNIVLIDPEMDISSEICEFMDSNKCPLVLTVSYLPEAVPVIIVIYGYFPITVRNVFAGLWMSCSCEAKCLKP
jgi:hypothetical protein